VTAPDGQVAQPAGLSRPRDAAPLISVRELTKVYPTAKGERVQALSRISLDIAQGEFVSLVGPSGCGKTTVLRILAGLIADYTGDVSVSGKALHGPSREVGVVFQDANLMPWRTALANVLLPAEVLGLNRKQAKLRAQELLTMVGLEGFERKLPGELSGGMRQRVAIARALIHDPAVLLLDEPFGALDAMTRDTMNVELASIAARSKKTVFLITHSIAEAVFLSDRVLVMSSRPGRIVEVIPVELPRPRGLDIIADPGFAATVLRIRRLLDGVTASALPSIAH
jgi:NitT/TauT family transport system ATP-binding protein